VWKQCGFGGRGLGVFGCGLGVTGGFKFCGAEAGKKLPRRTLMPITTANLKHDWITFQKTWWFGQTNIKN